MKELFLLFSLLCNMNIGGGDVYQYWFVMKNSYGNELPYYTHRIYINKNTFIDTKYLKYRKEIIETDTFKLCNETLFHSFDNEFYELLSTKQFEEGDTSFLRNEYYREEVHESLKMVSFIHFVPYRKDNTEYIFKDIRHTPPNPGIYEIDGPVFNPNKGIVAEYRLSGRYNLTEIPSPFD